MENLFFKVNIDDDRNANETEECVNQAEAGNAHVGNNVELGVAFDCDEDKNVRDDAKRGNDQKQDEKENYKQTHFESWFWI